MTYSKSRVDRAGKLLTGPRLSDALATSGEAERLSALGEAFEIVEWWQNSRTSKC